VSSQRRDELRAADVDRVFVADLLKRAVDEGRLSLSEYDDRLRRTYEARTYGELDKVIGDLPKPSRRSGLVPASPAVPAPVRSSGSGSSRSWISPVWYAWFIAVGINTVIWLIVTVTSGEWVYPWPLWVAGPWGIVLLAGTLFNRRDRDAGRD
jgi:hypothetical protein